MIKYRQKNLRRAFAWPIIAQVVLSIAIVIAVALFHRYKSRLNDSILIAKRQAVLLDIIDNSAQSAIDGNRLSLTRLDGYMSLYHNSLLTLRHGGSVDYSKDRIELLQMKNQNVLDLLTTIEDTYKHYELNLNILLLNFSDKEKVKAIAQENLTQEYHTDLISYNEKLVDRLLRIKSNLKYITISSIIVLGLLMVAVLFIMLNYYLRFFKKPIERILDVTTKTGKGSIKERIDYQTEDELGEISNAIDSVIDNQQNVVKVLEKIGEGDFNIPFQKSSDNDVLGTAVEVMRERLQNFFEEDKRKSRISNWTNEGLAKFAEILRNHNDDIQSLANIISSELSNYVDGNQCAVYSLEGNVDEGEDQYLNLLATFAWKRKKHLERRLEIGEGLVGQCILEKDTIFLTEVPDSYVEITSGLGKANPTCILIVPMQVNEEIYGVIEIASFKRFEDFEISFVEKVAQSIAASISTVRTNEHTRMLLEESQLLTEQMRAQEEELRQNAEELQATQESIEQKLELLDFEKKKTSAILETCVDGCISFNQYGKVEIFNKSAEDIWSKSAENVIGGNINELMPLQIMKEGESSVVYFVKGDDKTAVSIRTEVSIEDALGDEVPVLLTINESSIGGEQFFTVFVQSISVELF